MDNDIDRSMIVLGVQGNGTGQRHMCLLTLPKCRLLCEVDYESMPSFPIFCCSL